MTQRPSSPVFVDKEFKPHIIILGNGDMGLHAQIVREAQKLESERDITITNTDDVDELIESFYSVRQHPVIEIFPKPKPPRRPFNNRKQKHYNKRKQRIKNKSRKQNRK